MAIDNLSDLRPKPVFSLVTALKWTIPVWSIFLLFSHPLWFDEIQAWQIAVNSPTPLDLFWNLKHEGHPIFWYLILWVASFMQQDAEAVRFVNLFISIFIFWMIIVKSPFSDFEKILLSANFFIILDCGILARSYSLAMALSMLYAHLIIRHPTLITPRIWLLGVMANLSAFTGIVSFVLFIYEYYHDHLQRRHSVTYLILLLFAALTMAPEGDVAPRETFYSGFTHILSQSLNFICLPFLPIVIGNTVPPPNILIIILWVLYFMRCALLYVPFFSSFKKPLAIWIVCCFLFVCFGTVIYDGRIWHASVMFSVLVLCLWLAIGASPPHARPSLAILFLPGAISGFAYSILVVIYPLSHSSNVARWIVGNGHQNDLVIAAPDTMTAVIIGTKLKQPVFDPGCRCYPQFAVWSNRNQGALSETPNWIAMEMQRRDTHQALVVVPSNNRDFLPILADAKQFSVAILATFSNAVLTDENYIIFQITVPAAPR